MTSVGALAVVDGVRDAATWLVETVAELAAWPVDDALGWVLGRFEAELSLSLGWALVGLAAAVRLLRLPLDVRAARSVGRLHSLAPEMKAIQHKYRHDRQKQSEELMRFYRENKLNPYGGVPPFLFQSIIVFSLYLTLANLDDRSVDVSWWAIHDTTEGYTVIDSFVPFFGAFLVAQILWWLSRASTAVWRDLRAPLLILALTPVVVGVIAFDSETLDLPIGIVIFYGTNSLITVALSPFIRPSSAHATRTSDSGRSTRPTAAEVAPRPRPVTKQRPAQESARSPGSTNLRPARASATRTSDGGALQRERARRLEVESELAKVRVEAEEATRQRKEAERREKKAAENLNAQEVMARQSRREAEARERKARSTLRKAEQGRRDAVAAEAALREEAARLEAIFARLSPSARYQFRGPLGRGGMGSVGHFFDQELRRDVALKLLLDRYLGDDGIRRRFLREAQYAVQLDPHPNVVQVLDITFDEEGRPYIVMEFVDGRDLDWVIADSGPLGELDAVSIGRQAAAGLAHIHRAGMVHRDVKPKNLLQRRSDGVIKVTDLGIALADDWTRLTGVGEHVRGTRGYAAPEQWSGLTVSPLSDIYSLGVVLYELLVGVLPVGFAADDDGKASTLEHLASLDVRLKRLIAECLAVDPAARPPTMEAVQRQLEAISDVKRTTPRRARRTPRRLQTTRELPTVPLRPDAPVQVEQQP